MSDLVDRLSVLQVLLAERYPDHYATVCEAIAEVRRLRDREARARELATITVDTLDDLRADALRDEWSRWLETE